MAKTPDKTFKVGSIQFAIWSNKTDKGVFRTVSITNSYYDGKEWKETKSFKANDLGKLLTGVNKVMEYLFVKDSDKAEEADF